MMKVTLTNEILSYIIEIEHNRYKVSSVKLSKPVMNRLRKNSKKKSSYASNKIEGNPLSEKQVDEVIERDERKHYLKPEQEERKESSPCALCAKMRKGALNDYAKQIGCNKVAYAHHMDDIIETMFLSMFYEGQFYSFAPVTYLDRSGITVIRPLMYVPEANVIGFLHKYHLPLVKNPCPADGETKREYVKQLVRQINLENPGVKKRIFHAICTGRIEGWNINGKQ